MKYLMDSLQYILFFIITLDVSLSLTLDDGLLTARAKTLKSIKSIKAKYEKEKPEYTNNTAA